MVNQARTIELAVGERLIELRQSYATLLVTDEHSQPYETEFLSHEELQNFAKILSNKAANAGGDIVKDFDRKVSGMVHAKFSPFMTPALIADAGFWRWLAIAYFAEMIENRSNKNPGYSGPAGYGLGALNHNRVYILYMGAEILFDEGSSNPYHQIELVQHSDFLESFLVRVNMARCRNLARVFTNWQYKNKSVKDPEKVYLNTNDEKGVRSVFKLLRRRHASIPFEYLSDSEIHAMLDEMVEQEGLLLAK